MSFVRYPGEGQPYPFLPGSSIKGVLRSGVEQLLRGTGQECCDPFKNRCSKPSAERDLRCPACLLFGSTHGAAVAAVDDAVPWPPGTQPDMRTEWASRLLEQSAVRNGVGIDRETGSAKSGVLFDFEVLVDPVFYGAVTFRNPTAQQVGLLCAALELLNLGALRVGAMTTRGLGQVAVSVRDASVVAVSPSKAAPLLIDAGAFGEPVRRGLVWEWRVGGPDGDARARLLAARNAFAAWAALAGGPE
jgi:CRISPR/Cas system CSM-associated protein Csm3 (group 7 of RAMP superfamily)